MPLTQRHGTPLCATSVGAGLPAKDVNDDARCLENRAACDFFASKLAPTETHKQKRPDQGRGVFMCS
jgi:hypothetical protein